MSEERKRTTLGHDDDGNIDDRRIAAAVILLAGVAMAVMDMWDSYTAQAEVIKGLLYAGVLLMSSTVAEKFKAGPK